MKGMIISVGGTPEPIITTLLTHRPAYVCFFVSHQSVDLIGAIKEKTRQADVSFTDYKIITDDTDDLVLCYARARACAARMTEWGIPPDQVLVDYTGGTKTMTAALALATIGNGSAFSYIGGKSRTKNGLGVVVTGEEIVHQGVSPWQIFAVEEKKRVALFVSTYQYDAAVAVMQTIALSLSSTDREICSGLTLVLQAYQAWDAFRHGDAVQKLSQGLKLLDPCCRMGATETLLPFIEKTRENHAILSKMQSVTRNFKMAHSLILLDLVSNASRRIRQGKHDDATARLYRALEMAGQIAFQEKFKCETGQVPLKVIPAGLQDDYAQQYSNPERPDFLQIPLYATFRVLHEVGHSQGLLFQENHEKFEKLLFARNNSILAHGFQAIELETAESFIKLVTDCFLSEPLIEFPTDLNW